jgi:hypothetical protein
MSESKVSVPLTHVKSLTHQGHKTIREIKEFVLYFMGPRLHCLDPKKGLQAQFPIAPVIVACFCERGAHWLGHFCINHETNQMAPPLHADNRLLGAQ